MKKLACYISWILWVIMGIFSIGGISWIYSRQEKLKERMNSTIGENRFLKDSFENLVWSDSVSVDSILLKHGRKIVSLSKAVSFPCLIIYLPSIREDVCNSCLIYALDEVKNTLKNFSTSKHICIISVGYNPEIKERIYRKECYVVDDAFLDVPRVNMPYYFVLEKDGNIKWLFSPNYLFKEFTEIYLKHLNVECSVFK